MSATFDTTPTRPDVRMANDEHGAYRKSAGVTCARCGSNAGDDYTFTTSGDVHCRACAQASAHALATSTAASAGAEFAGERRCKCGGVASAGKMVNEARGSLNVYARYMGETVELGGETVFGCVTCGQSFVILNRLRRVRLAVRALQIAFIGGLFGLIGLFAIGGPLGTLAFVVITVGVGGLGAMSLLKDGYLRRAHPPIE